MTSDKYIRDESEEEYIRQALLERPRFSIKARLTIMLLILFLMSAIVSGMAMYMLSMIDNRVQYIFHADLVATEIQYARRIEKNFFLYNSNLSEIMGHLDKSDKLLNQALLEFENVIGKAEFNSLKNAIQKYKLLAEKLIVNGSDSTFLSSGELQATAHLFRSYGSKILELSLDISKKERQLVSNAISKAQNVQIALMAVILLSLIYIVTNVTKHIIRRLNRLIEATQRLAAGDFTPITPRRKYKDEFSLLAIAFNHMMYELEKRQELLVESHKLRAIGNLTAGIAHELNNPLNNIILTSEILKEDFKQINDDECLDMLNDLIIQGERARQVVKNLLDYARESETQAERFFIKEIIENTMRLIKNQAMLSKVKMITEIEDNLPPIYGDIKLLTQVFLNLFINAIDAMPDGGTLIITVKEEKKFGFLSIKVTDTGTGIPPHLLKSIFNPFFTTKPQGEGTGLGLSVSKGIIEKHGGNIDVVSQLGLGTTFTIHLPIVTIPADISVKNNGNN